MKRQSIIIFFLLLLSFFLNAQQDLALLDSLSDHLIKTNYDSAIKVLNDELANASRAKNLIYITKSKRKLGLANYFMARYDRSLSFYLEALQIAEANNMDDELLLLYNLLGTEYKKINKLEDSRLWFNKGLSLSQHLNRKNFIAGFSNDIGLVYQLEKQPDSAYKYFKAGLDLYKEDNNLLGESYSLDYLSELETNRGNFAKGVEFIKESVLIREKLGDKNILAVALNNTGEIYNVWGKPDEAISYFLQSLSLSKAIGYYDLSQYTMKQLYKCYKAIGDVDNALFYFEESARIKDSIINEKNLKNLNELDAKYQSEKKQLQINNLNSENKLKAEKIRQQNYALLLFISLLLVLTVSILLIVKNSRKMRQANKIISLQKEHAEQQHHLIELKQKEILDSIYYARRIQNSLLTSEKLIEKTLRRMLNK